MPVPVVVSEAHRQHDPPYEVNLGRPRSPVFERPARVEQIREAMAAAGHRLHEPTEHGDGPVTAVHAPELLGFLERAYDEWRAAGGPEVVIPDTFVHPRWADGARPTPAPLGAPGYWCIDTATPLVAGSYVAARAACDVALSAADLVRGGVPVAYALCRPPGHHAGPDYYGGFCLLNPAAVTARSLTDGGKVAVLDVDYHHGNGTQDVFWRDPSVLYASIHGDPSFAYPYFTGFADEAGEGPGRGATLNVPLGSGADGDAYGDALDAVIDRIGSFDPVALVVSLGFDTSTGDPLGSFALTAADYTALGRGITGLGLPTVVVQEGGYDVGAIGANAVAFFEQVG